jgi:hypothetical protein
VREVNEFNDLTPGLGKEAVTEFQSVSGMPPKLFSSSFDRLARLSQSQVVSLNLAKAITGALTTMFSAMIDSWWCPWRVCGN